MNMTEQELLEELGRLPRERQPQADLWPGVEARIRPMQARSFRRIPTAIAAAIVGSLVTAFGLSINERMETTAPAFVQTLPATGAGMTYASGVDLEYSGALRDLAGQMQSWQRAGQDGSVLMSNLRVLSEASEELRAAIAEDPQSIYLAQLLASTQKKQLSVMRELLMQRDSVSSYDTDQRRT